MENKIEITMYGLCKGYIGLYRGYLGFRVYNPPIMENQMEKNMDNETETWAYIGVYGDLGVSQN